jgi:short subunit dehydrogenase-like uncharacterized protein
MAYNILLYGATGYSGKLIAVEGKARFMSAQNGGSEYRMILAARDGAQLREIAKKNGMEYRIFGLDNRNEVKKGLESIDVVINAAGPFAFTAEPLAKAALDSRCHYVDINGEVDVYLKLDDFGYIAELRGVAMVSGAGNVAAASDVLLNVALKNFKVKDKELGAVRIAVSQITDFSRGSIATAMRYLREQVVVIRERQSLDRDGQIRQLVICHEPVGKLERTFNFGDLPYERDDRKADRRDDRSTDERDNRRERKNLRIASAANLVDTLTALHTVQRNNFRVRTIESYVQMGAFVRAAYQLGGMFSSLSTFPWVRPTLEALLWPLPEGPTPQDRKKEYHVVLLEIEDVYRSRVIDWRWETPNVYQFTAQLVVEIACRVAKAEGEKRGWVTPAGVLNLQETKELSGATPELRPYLRGCELEERELEVEEIA